MGDETDSGPLAAAAIPTVGAAPAAAAVGGDGAPVESLNVNGVQQSKSDSMLDETRRDPSLSCLSAGASPRVNSRASMSRSPTSRSPMSRTPTTSRRQSESSIEATAAKVVLFPGSGTLAAATIGAIGSVAAVATGGVALLGAGAAICAFKFSPSLNQESRATTRQEDQETLAKAKEELEKKKTEEEEEQNKPAEDTLATVLSARDNHAFG